MEKVPKKTDYLHMLRFEKPWLANLPTLSQTKLEILQHSFPFEESEFKGGLLARLKDAEKIQACKKEIQFIQKEVAVKKNVMREKKSDIELMHDARFYNKYGDFLLMRMKQKS